MLVHVRPSAHRVIMLKDGEVYLRIGDQSRKLTASDLLALEYARDVRSFEEQIVVDATMDDLDADLLEQYAATLKSEVSSIEDLLRARGVIKTRNRTICITNACVLLFGRNPTQFLPGARVRFLRYDGVHEGVGDAMNIIKDENVELPLHKLLQYTQRLLSSQMREFQVLSKDGIFRKHPEYPAFAWLEGLVNAVTHRNYALRGDYIRINMFDDRIEFLSPGQLPNIVTIDNIRYTRYARNPIISRVLFDFGWVRELNEGVKRIYLDMASFFLDPPIFSQPGDRTKLVLRNNIAMRSIRRLEEVKRIVTSEAWSGMDDLERQIVIIIANTQRCTMKQLIQQTGKSRVTIQKRLARLSPHIVKEHRLSVTDPTKFYSL